MAAICILLFVFVVSTLGIPFLQNILEPLLVAEKDLDILRSLLLTLGGALLGATAIVSSLVLFSMQVNVDRMPHGFFRRLSGDHRLLSAFAAGFLLAIVVAALALVPGSQNIGVTVFLAIWATGLILILFLYCYRRALVLINPVRQLDLVILDTRREMQTWVRRANRAADYAADPHLPPNESTQSALSNHDLKRVAFFQANDEWTDGARQAVRYAVAFARRFAEQGDHEVSAAAMNAIIAINAAYVEAKGRTFFSDQIMFENPLTSDSFINNSLEHLRQMARIGVSRADEQQIEQTLGAIAALARVYASIDYGNPLASRTHAHLAAAYLSAEAERIVAHNMPDVLMEAARLMGQSAEIFLRVEGPAGIQILVQRLGIIGCTGVSREEYRPVTLVAVQHLSNLSFNLLRTRINNVQSGARAIRSSMCFLGKLFLAVPDTPLLSAHSTYLGPYYSATSLDGLIYRLGNLANSIGEATPEDARQIISNIDAWADGIHRSEKELFLEAVVRRSHFTFDMIRWIKHITSILLAISCNVECSEQLRRRLRKHALWLSSVLSFVPEDKESVEFVETMGFTEVLFECALDTHRRTRTDITDSMGNLIIWMFKGGRHDTAWSILERSVYGLSVIALLDEQNVASDNLKIEIGKRLAAGGLPDQNVRDQAAIEVRGRAEALPREGHLSSSIERGMAGADHLRLEPLLRELADLISPETAGQASKSYL